MFTIIFGGIGIIFDLLIIAAIIALGGKIIIKIAEGIKHIIEALSR